MPRRSAHVALGVGSALAAGRGILARVPACGQLSTLAGLLVGGLAGGRAPDLLEPPDSPNHRDTFHSLAAGSLVLWIAMNRTNAVVDSLLGMGAACRTRRDDGKAGGRDSEWLICQEHACYFMIGLLVGFEAGYLSHLVADALTPGAVPVLARGIM